MTIPWRQYFQVAVTHLAVTPSEFWKLTFAEFWALYDMKFGGIIPPLTKVELENLEDRWVNGNS